MALENDFTHLACIVVRNLDKVACLRIAIDGLMDVLSEYEKSHRKENEDFSELSVNLEHMQTALEMIDDETNEIYSQAYSYKNDKYKALFAPRGVR